MAVPTQCITLEEHATIPSLGDENDFYNEVWSTFPPSRQALRDLGAGRLADMDAGHVAVQVISALPGTATYNPSGCRAANDELAAVVAAHPSRFRAFAALPMQHPTDAARELERAVQDLRFVGAMIDNHLVSGTADHPEGAHYDAEPFWPVFAAAERLDVPLYLHPAPPSRTLMSSRFKGNFPAQVAMGLATGAHGWHEEVGLHVLKLYAAGLFQRFPNLKIILGHNGEMLPMMIDRVDKLTFFTRAGLPKFSEAWERNIWVTTSGMFSVRALKMLLMVTKPERVMYSIDTPFRGSAVGWEFVEELAGSGVFTPEQMEGFVYGNAKALLKI